MSEANNEMRKNVREESCYPPAHGLPAADRFKPGRELQWGETPFDDLSRGELLRLVQAYHCAATSARSVLSIAKLADERHPYWSVEGSGGSALAKLDQLMQLAGDGSHDEDSEGIYRSFFRYAIWLMFPFETRWRWGVKGDEMSAPFHTEEGFREITWADILPRDQGNRATIDVHQQEPQ